MARLLLVTLLAALVPTYAHASPVTWAWAGQTTTDAGLDIIPLGTPLRLTYYSDSDSANMCGSGAATGLYTGGYALLDIQSQGGTMTYRANATYLFMDANGVAGCGTANPGRIELRLAAWEGPAIPCGSTCLADQNVFATTPLGPPGGLFFGQGSGGPAFPSQQPGSAYLEGPWFETSEITEGRQRHSLFGTFDAVAVPEPRTWLLLGLGLAAVVTRRRPTRGHRG